MMSMGRIDATPERDADAGAAALPSMPTPGFTPDVGIEAAGRVGEIMDPPEVPPVGGTPRAAMMSKDRGQGAMMPRGDRPSPESLLSLAKGGGTRPRKGVAKRKQRNCDRVSCRFVRAVR